MTTYVVFSFSLSLKLKHLDSLNFDVKICNYQLNSHISK